MSWDTIDLDRGDGVATITVDRPDRLNALNTETLEALEVALAEAEDARALVLTGAGEKAFVAGADIAYMDRERDRYNYVPMAHWWGWVTTQCRTRRNSTSRWNPNARPNGNNT